MGILTGIIIGITVALFLMVDVMIYLTGGKSLLAKIYKSMKL